MFSNVLRVLKQKIIVLSQREMTLNGVKGSIPKMVPSANARAYLSLQNGFILSKYSMLSNGMDSPECMRYVKGRHMWCLSLFINRQPKITGVTSAILF